jgi:IS5 family transposase
MLTRAAGQVECLWDEVPPMEAKALPEGLARLDRALSDEMLLVPIARAWEQTAPERGRPPIAMTSSVRLMVIRERTGWGYETLVTEVSDSLHLRRFCLIGIDQRLPDKSTVRKLPRRLGPEVVREITRMVIERRRGPPHRRRGWIPRWWQPISAIPRIRCSQCRARGPWRGRARSFRDCQQHGAGCATRRGRWERRCVRSRGRWRNGRAGQRAAHGTQPAGRTADRLLCHRGLAGSWRSARLGAGSHSRAEARPVGGPLPARGRADRPTCPQPEDHRPAVSISDPDARPIRMGKLGKPTEFGYVAQICEITENIRRGTRGLILAGAHMAGNPAENRFLTTTADELARPRASAAEDRPVHARAYPRRLSRAPKAPDPGVGSPRTWQPAHPPREDMTSPAAVLPATSSASTAVKRALSPTSPPPPTECRWHG